ncbi:hypothetical protein [Saccharophagus degradans]|uniref:hypothetical protein n=1 Tax=Saccharophagus degradans TaxID=86304 RepID=UPI00117EDC7F|nr:hypothetical protein [Saccharophagus degradans]
MLDRQCNIRLSESLLRQLQDCADLEQISVSEFIRLKLQGVVVRNRRKLINGEASRNINVYDLYSDDSGFGHGSVAPTFRCR